MHYVIEALVGDKGKICKQLNNAPYLQLGLEVSTKRLGIGLKEVQKDAPRSRQFVKTYVFHQILILSQI